MHIQSCYGSRILLNTVNDLLKIAVIFRKITPPLVPLIACFQLCSIRNYSTGLQIYIDGFRTKSCRIISVIPDLRNIQADNRHGIAIDHRHNG